MGFNALKLIQKNNIFLSDIWRNRHETFTIGYKQLALSAYVVNVIDNIIFPKY